MRESSQHYYSKTRAVTHQLTWISAISYPAYHLYNIVYLQIVQPEIIQQAQPHFQAHYN